MFSMTNIISVCSKSNIFNIKELFRKHLPMKCKARYFAASKNTTYGFWLYRWLGCYATYELDIHLLIHWQRTYKSRPIWAASIDFLQKGKANSLIGTFSRFPLCWKRILTRLQQVYCRFMYESSHDTTNRKQWATQVERSFLVRL